MAVSFTSTPLSAFTGPRPAGQKLIYTMYDATTPDRYVVYVYESDTFGVDGTEIAKLYLTPNAAGYAHFDLSDIVEGRVNAPKTRLGPTITHTVQATANNPLDDGIRMYTVKAAQYNSGTESAIQATAGRLYLTGGAHQLSEGLDPDFTGYYPTSILNKVWLSDQSFTIAGNRRTDMYMSDEDEAACFLINTLFLGATTLLARIEYKLYDDTGTLVHTEYLNTSTSTTIYQNLQVMPLGPTNVAGIMGANWDTSWSYYDIRPVGSATPITAYGRTIRVYRDCRPYKHDAVQLAWTNTVGGWDYLRFDGRNLKTINTETKSYRKTIGSYDASSFSYLTYDRQTTPYQVTGKETWALRNRYFEAFERDLLQYAFRSKEVMYRVGSGDWLPCTIQTNTYTVQPAASQLFDVAFNIELSQEIRC